MFGFRCDADDLAALVAALKVEEDGKLLRRDLIKNLRVAVQPAVQEIRGGLLAMSTLGLPAEGPPLRTAVLKQLKTEVRLGGRSAGVKIRIRKRGMPRDFPNAPKRLNRKSGWRHPVHGRDVWVHQVGEPEYFDRPTRQHRAEYRAAVRHAMNEAARRVTRKV